MDHHRKGDILRLVELIDGEMDRNGDGAGRKHVRLTVSDFVPHVMASERRTRVDPRSGKPVRGRPGLRPTRAQIERALAMRSEKIESMGHGSVDVEYEDDQIIGVAVEERFRP